MFCQGVQLVVTLPCSTCKYDGILEKVGNNPLITKNFNGSCLYNSLSPYITFTFVTINSVL